MNVSTAAGAPLAALAFTAAPSAAQTREPLPEAIDGYVPLSLTAQADGRRAAPGSVGARI